MGGLETLLPQLAGGGVFAILFGVIVYLLRTNVTDRRDYRVAVESWEGQLDDQLDRYDAQVVRYRELQEILDKERTARRKAEDEAARATRAVERATEKLERATAEIAALRDEVAALRAKISEMNGS